MYYFKSLERPISNSELSEIEKKIKVILPEDYSEYQMELPYDSFVLGTEYGGGLFVMIVSGEDRGIYFWDHTFIFDQSSVDSNVYFLADNFTNFIEKLYISEP